MAVSVECHYFQGAFPSDPLTGVVYPCTPRGHSSQTPIAAMYTFPYLFVGLPCPSNKKCGRRVRPIRYAPAGL